MAKLKVKWNHIVYLRINNIINYGYGQDEASLIYISSTLSFSLQLQFNLL